MNNHKVTLLLTVFGLAFMSPIFAQLQQANRRQETQFNCRTPENYYGTCVTLSYCPQVVNIFNTRNQQVAQQYVFALQRSCGTRNINGDPVICCTRPLTNVFPNQGPVTPAPNPFLSPTTLRNTRNPQSSNPFLNGITTASPVVSTTKTIATTTTARPVTSAPLTEKGAFCKGPDTRDGYCVALEKCQELVDELYSKQNDENFPNYLRQSNKLCGGMGSIICCPSAVSQNRETITWSNTDEIPRRLPTTEEGCGYTTSSFKKIVGGEVSKKGAWPWIALIGYDDGLSLSPFKCGGTLITSRHVVTAAHCIRNDLTFVRLGEHDLLTDTEARHVDIPVVRKESHAEYNRKNGRSDIAILYLQSNVKFNDFISPICLPTSQSLRQKSYEGFSPFVVGWGKTMEGGKSANILQELQIPVIGNEYCKNQYRKQNRLLSEDQFDSAVICAGVTSGGKDTCQGDSGGPLMIPETYKTGSRFYLIGVVSYGIGCARPDIPGVYTSTQFFIDWIVQKVADTS